MISLPYTQTRTYHQYLLLVPLILLIGFQQFPVINVGGTLKLYEILALIILFFYWPKFEWNWTMAGFFLLFVISPILSFAYSSLFLEKPLVFFYRYSESRGSFRFDNFGFNVLQVIFMFFNFAVVAAIANNKWIFLHMPAILKKSLYIGTGIALFSLACFVVNDNPIYYLPKWIHHLTRYYYRVQGLSQEPSFYVLYQCWIVIINFYLKDKFNGIVWLLMLVVNIAALLLTFSSSISAFLLILAASPFLLRHKMKVRFAMVFLLGILFAASYLFLKYNGYLETVAWTLYDKVSDFFSSSNTQAVSSGGFRSYTSKIGFEIFKDYPLFGVGVGNSTFYMTTYSKHILSYKTVGALDLGIFPQSLYASVPAEQGIFGALGLMIVITGILFVTFKNRNKTRYHKMFFLGALFNIAVMFAIQTAYSLFLWVFLALALNYLNFYEKKYENCH